MTKSRTPAEKASMAGVCAPPLATSGATKPAEPIAPHGGGRPADRQIGWITSPPACSRNGLSQRGKRGRGCALATSDLHEQRLMRGCATVSMVLCMALWRGMGARPPLLHTHASLVCSAARLAWIQGAGHAEVNELDPGHV